MNYRLQLVCRDCEHPGATTCRDGSPPFVTGPAGETLDFTTLADASEAAEKLRGDLGARILREAKVGGGWEVVAPPPKAKSVLD